MATAQDLINSAAKLAGILAEGQTLEGGVNTDALNRLNRMLSRWRNSGIDLGLATLAASDTIYVDEADEEAIEAHLALRLMARHRRPIDPQFQISARDMYEELRAKYMTITDMDIDLALQKPRAYNINYE